MEPSESGYFGSSKLSAAYTGVTPTIFTELSDDRNNDFPPGNYQNIKNAFIRYFQNLYFILLLLLTVSYSISDISSDYKNLLTWRTTEGKAHISYGGSSINYDGKENVLFITAQKIPTSLPSFSFEIEVTNHQENTNTDSGNRMRLGVGVSTEFERICYMSFGRIRDMSDFYENIDEGSSFGTNDVISVHLRTINTDPLRRQLVFMKNEKKVGERILDVKGQHIRPLLWILEEKQNIEIKSFLGTTKHSYSFGMLIQ